MHYSPHPKRMYSSVLFIFLAEELTVAQIQNPRENLEGLMRRTTLQVENSAPNISSQHQDCDISIGSGSLWAFIFHYGFPATCSTHLLSSIWKCTAKSGKSTGAFCYGSQFSQVWSKAPTPCLLKIPTKYFGCKPNSNIKYTSYWCRISTMETFLFVRGCSKLLPASLPL